MKPKQSASRSRRLRKKLRIDEFAEYGFEVECFSVPGLTQEIEDHLLDDFIEGAIEANQLSVGGGSSSRNGRTNYGFFTASYSGAVGQAEMDQVQAWLKADSRVDTSTIQVGPLVDAWYFEAEDAPGVG